VLAAIAGRTSGRVLQQPRGFSDKSRKSGGFGPLGRCTLRGTLTRRQAPVKAFTNIYVIVPLRFLVDGQVLGKHDALHAD
jgi:hypothetical protein